MPAIPIAIRRKPFRTSGAVPTRNTVRSWIQAPVVHAIVPPVRASAERTTLSPRIVVTVSGTNTSAAKKANVRIPLESTAAGSGPCALNVPAGSRFRSAGTPRTSPIATSPGDRTMSRACRPARATPAPAATRTASSNTRRATRSGLAGTLRSSRSASEPATITSGRRPRKTDRQPMWSATNAASAGPAMPGTTQAVERIANIRGRSESG